MRQRSLQTFQRAPLRYDARGHSGPGLVALQWPRLAGVEEMNLWILFSGPSSWVGQRKRHSCQCSQRWEREKRPGPLHLVHITLLTHCHLYRPRSFLSNLLRKKLPDFLLDRKSSHDVGWAWDLGHCLVFHLSLWICLVSHPTGVLEKKENPCS